MTSKGSDEGQEVARELARAVAREVFIPLGLEERAVLLRGPSEHLQQVSGALPDLAASFRRNIEAVLAVVSLPYWMTYSATMDRWFQYDLIKASLLREENSTREDIAGAASRNLQDALTQPGGQQNLFVDEIVSHLARHSKGGEFSSACKELHRQALVLTWGAVEVLAKDLFVTVLNAEPQNVIALAADDRTKRRLSTKGISLETLSEYGFDVSTRMGDVMSSLYDLDSLPAMRDAYRALSRDDDEVRGVLDDKALWLLYQKRHLIVHRRAIVDRDYLEKTGDTATVGTELVVTPNEVKESINLAVRAATTLMRWASGIPALKG